MPSTTRRRFLRAISAGGIPALAGCGMPSPDLLSGWAQFGYDPANTSAALDLHGPAERPGAEWVHTAGSYYRNSTQILLAENVIANAGYTGLYALSPTDGTIQWHDSTSYKPLTPVLANGIIYAFDITLDDDEGEARYTYSVRPAPFPDHSWVETARTVAATNTTDDSTESRRLQST